MLAAGVAAADLDPDGDDPVAGAGLGPYDLVGVDVVHQVDVEAAFGVERLAVGHQPGPAKWFGLLSRSSSTDS